MQCNAGVSVKLDGQKFQTADADSSAQGLSYSGAANAFKPLNTLCSALLLLCTREHTTLTSECFGWCDSSLIFPTMSLQDTSIEN